MVNRRSKAERTEMAALVKAVERRMRIGSVIALCLLVLGGLAAVVIFGQREAKDRDSQLVQWDPRWPPLPPHKRRIGKLEHIQQAYAFAARREDVVSYLPCYCGCAREGHTSLRSCFIKSRTANGNPVWDAMGFT